MAARLSLSLSLPPLTHAVRSELTVGSDGGGRNRRPALTLTDPQAARSHIHSRACMRRQVPQQHCCSRCWCWWKETGFTHDESTGSRRFLVSLTRQSSLQCLHDLLLLLLDSGAHHARSQQITHAVVGISSNCSATRTAAAVPVPAALLHPLRSCPHRERRVFAFTRVS